MSIRSWRFLVPAWLFILLSLISGVSVFVLARYLVYMSRPWRPFYRKSILGLLSALSALLWCVWFYRAGFPAPELQAALSSGFIALSLYSLLAATGWDELIWAWVERHLPAGRYEQV